jgi:hypothetical protein
MDASELQAASGEGTSLDNLPSIDGTDFSLDFVLIFHLISARLPI